MHPVFPLDSAPASAASRPTVRPPWPDELPRVLATFPELSRSTPCFPLVLLAGRGPERIVGAASVVGPDAEGVAGVSIALRTRWLDSESGARLIAETESVARRAGARRMVTTDDREESHPLTPLLRGGGFIDYRRVEFWSTDLPTLKARIARIDARLARGGKTNPFVALPLAPEHLPAVRTLMAAERMFAPEDITIKGMAGGRGFDPRYSFVVYDGDALAGVILVRRLNLDTAFVDGEAVAPAWRGGLDLVHHRLYEAAATHGLADGISSIIYTVDTSTAMPAHRMARRTASTLKRTILRLSRDLV